MLGESNKEKVIRVVVGIILLVLVEIFMKFIGVPYDVIGYYTIAFCVCLMVGPFIMLLIEVEGSKFDRMVQECYKKIKGFIPYLLLVSITTFLAICLSKVRVLKRDSLYGVSLTIILVIISVISFSFLVIFMIGIVRPYMEEWGEREKERYKKKKKKEDERDEC